MILASLSALEWVIIALGIIVVGSYIGYSIYRKKHPKQKKKDDEDE